MVQVNKADDTLWIEGDYFYLEDISELITILQRYVDTGSLEESDND